MPEPDYAAADKILLRALQRKVIPGPLVVNAVDKACAPLVAEIERWKALYEEAVTNAGRWRYKADPVFAAALQRENPELAAAYDDRVRRADA